ncbi:nucleoside-diphosphate-sugar pyrophosphorylase [Serpentinimonas raichei]|uniref:Nucleoside-diphosphate-sugar pyrophosphorylase n=1 Tax=Serpentinimonas raichei TaxID=1458425 RepID=A0A060NKS0_9BURK|nr:sugar phosphate nucleotidyltransferase [Serpentinimonas raichei]BAO81910.1 nucleoside-diphosphate-sugar pyrophosphorylase [Serpentinimonas raichei]
MKPPTDPVLPASALLLAAGRGERMRPLTDRTPKPLLALHGQPLIAWHLDALARAGVRHALINTAWLGEQLPERLGSSWPVDAASASATPLALSYSHEGRDFGGALETAGGIARALPALAECFWAVAADAYVPGFAFDPAALQRFAASGLLAHLWLVPNPAQHPGGDFGLDLNPGPSHQGCTLALNLPPTHPGPRYTFSGLALYRRELFAPPWLDIAPGNPQGIRAALAPLLRHAMDNQMVSAELYPGPWADVGTPERLAALEARIPL